MKINLFYASLFLFLFSSKVTAQNKSQYSLFNPAPQNLMREFVTDRPDKTEAPYTVDAGHFQYEADLVNVVSDSEKSSTNNSYLFAAPNLKVGLTNSTDLQVVVQSYVYNHSSNPSHSQAGYGDTLIRLKQNFWGNDEGVSAFGLMPYVKIPTNHRDLGNDSYEGGLIAPLALTLGKNVGLGLMTEIDILRDDGDTGNFAQFVNSATVSTALTETTGGYLEIWSAASQEATHQLTLDAGFTYSPWKNIGFDIGVNIGVTEGADDSNPFLGLSQRF